ncbi:aldehyde oxidase GLOX1-like [Rosa rugosa]|uniref:aldehyde oxidase GLOX1-like n=1 Tax=Rosa rugosa TaxID=74645 RepID=UPI002B408A2C|nr:aldehyde oxidase GLOX1-like [Rosa rugosa]
MIEIVTTVTCVSFSDERNINAIHLAFLDETNDRPKIENNLYPFVFLNIDGNLFIFLNNRAILYNFVAAKVVKTFPILPGSKRSYPSTDSAVLLPLKLTGAIEAEVLEFGQAPVLNPVLYSPEKAIGSRFELQNTTSIPRIYHSRVVLLRDRQVLVGGSIPHDRYKFSDVLYSTELSLEAFSPDYLDSMFDHLHPHIYC